jgi:hypothetical protein
MKCNTWFRESSNNFMLAARAKGKEVLHLEFEAATEETGGLYHEIVLLLVLVTVT